MHAPMTAYISGYRIRIKYAACEFWIASRRAAHIPALLMSIVLEFKNNKKPTTRLAVCLHELRSETNLSIPGVHLKTLEFSWKPTHRKAPANANAEHQDKFYVELRQ